MKKDKVLIFIPMYNCEKQISRVLKKISDLGEKQQLFSEVVIIDNQSKDNSISVAKESMKELIIQTNILKNKLNRGLGGSHKVAFNYALENNFDYVIVLHGDDQGDIKDIVHYIENKEYEKYDSLLGSRFEKESKLINYSKFRILGNHIFNFFISSMAHRKVTDLGSGLNMYKTEYIKNGFFMYFPNNLTFNVYMLLYGVHVKSSFKFFPLSWSEDDQISNAKLFTQSKEILALTLKYVVRPKQLFNMEENEFSKLTYDYDNVYN